MAEKLSAGLELLGFTPVMDKRDIAAAEDDEPELNRRDERGGGGTASGRDRHFEVGFRTAMDGAPREARRHHHLDLLVAMAEIAARQIGAAGDLESQLGALG